MKYFTKELSISLNFYDKYNHRLTFEMFTLKHIYENKLSLNMEEGKKLIEDQYKKNIENYFNENILFSRELKEIIFYKDGNIKPLDEYIFFKIRMYASKCFSIDFEAENQHIENKLKIERGNYSTGVKYLSNHCQHDHNIKFEINKDSVKLIDKYCSDTWIFIFKLTYIDEVKFSNHTVFMVTDKEVIANDNGTFQYNILGYRSEEDINMGLDDIKIDFYDVEVRHINLKI